MKLETAAHWRQTMKLYHDVCPVSGPPGSHPPVPALSVSPTLSLESRVLASSVWVSSCTSASAHGLEEPSHERVVFVGPPPPLAGGGQNPCSFYLQDEGLVDSFQKRCTSEERVQSS